MVPMLTKGCCDMLVSCDDMLELIECDLWSCGACDMNVSQGICGNVAAPERYSIGESIEPRSGEYVGMEVSVS